MIYVCVLTRDSVNVNTTCDLIQLMRFSANYSFAAVVGTYIQTLREGTASAVLASGATHLCFIDSDMMFPKESIKILLSHDKDIIGANYIQRVDQTKWTAMTNGESVSSIGKSGLEEVDTLGMGVCLIKTEVFQKLPKPWFGMEWQTEGGYFLGEDISFCRLAKKHGFKIWIDHTLSQSVRHIGTIELGVDNFQMPEYAHPNIEGWMYPMEIDFLYNRAKDMKSIVEIGSWKGRSTHALASGCKNGKIYCVDHWRGSEGDITLGLSQKEDVYQVFKENTKEFKNIEIKRGFSHEIAQEFHKKVDMVFIDAGHVYEEVKRDIEDWLPKTKKLICGHDYSADFPGVVRAVNEKFGTPDGVIGTIWYKVISPKK